MASPNVTGTLLLLQEHYSNLNGGLMRAATLKGLALHTADEAGPNGPDAVYGWGLLNAKKAAETLTTAAASSGSAIVEELTLSQGQIYQITVQSNGVDPLMASISWTDPAGTVNNGTNSTVPALVNDLDIRLDNGATYTPWRLTSITTNGTGDNIVDPYERIDVNNASGSYTLTVTHKGTLSGSQNFSLIVTGIVVASTPVISFSSTVDNMTEDTDCSFIDVNIPLNIAQNPSENTDVNFTINGSSTATSGLDFDLMTSSIVFPTGSTTSQNMILRIYNDGFVEGNETVVIDFTVNANGGDATGDLNADSFTLTINDDDVAIAVQNISVLNEDFENTAGWTVIDNDGDTQQWGIFLPYSHGNLTGNWAGSITNLAVVGGSGTLTPDNFLSSPVFTIPAVAIDAQFKFEIGAFDNPEHYAVYFTTDKSSVANILAGTLIEERNTISNNTETRVINNASLAGQTGYLSIRHFNTTGNSILVLDSVDVTASIPVTAQTAVNTGSTNDQQTLSSGGTIYTRDSVTGYLMLDITNNQSDDYECLEVSVSRAGTGTQSYNGSANPDLVMDKTFEVLTENTTGGTGSTSMIFYFTEAEIVGWETGITPTQDRNNIVIGREIEGVITEVSTATIGAFGDNVTLTGNFTDTRGTYIFGASNPVAAMNPCANDPNVWIGSSWSRGTPTTDQMAIMLSPYNTSSGDLDVCSLIIWNTLIVESGSFVKVDGDITVRSTGTLTIEHEGSLVQVDDLAEVKNDGTISVKKTTPVLSHDSFSILGSPMSGATRDIEYAANNVVLNHDTNNFMLHPDVTALDPLAVHFADDNGDNWAFMVGNVPINVTEGYLVGPTTPSVSSGFYELNYNQGTLNNGIYTYNALLHIDEDNSANMLSNPYASAIDARDFITTNSSIIDVVYFWEHLTPPLTSYPGYRIENWDMGDISFHNGTMGNMAPNGGAIPSHFIPSGQGFAIKAKTGGLVTFNNAMRVTGPNTGYRNNEALDKLYLKVENPTYHLQSSTGIGFMELATDGYESNYDNKRLATPISIYSVLEEKELAIQGRSPFNENHIIPIGFRTMVEESEIYIISISLIEGGNLSEATVYLKDNLLNATTNLSEGDYTFTSNESNQKDRFVIVFTEEVLGSNDFNESSISVYPNPTKDYINIVSPLTEITDLTVYDVRGRMLQTLKVNNQTSYQLDMSNLETSMYFVKFHTQNGSITKQIIKQ